MDSKLGAGVGAGDPVKVAGTSYGDVAISQASSGEIKVSRGIFSRNFTCGEVQAFAENARSVCEKGSPECVRADLKAADVATSMCKASRTQITHNM